ncbi:MAG TPA: glycosyltransferase family 2 protein [Thermoleophilia bacterium]|nr:glycosyltransferase family 2 protein [Thermoleophilia bacterium]
MSYDRLITGRLVAEGALTWDSVSFVIPALNEEGAVGATIKSVPHQKLLRLGLTSEILVVDNDSMDGTAIEAARAGAVVLTEVRRGYGSAFLKGLAVARGDILVLCDADGTYPIEDAAALIRPIAEGRADLVIGSRTKGGIDDGAMPWHHRHIGNPVLTWLQNRLFGTRISDAHCGLRAISKDAFLALGLECCGMEFAPEMLIKAAANRLRIEEIPVRYRPRFAGKPKLRSFRDGWRHLKFLIVSFVKLRVIPTHGGSGPHHGSH